MSNQVLAYTMFRLFLGLNFFQYQSLEIKVIKTREKVDDLVSGATSGA